VVDTLDFLVPTAISSVLGTDWPIVALEDACDAERPITYGIVQAGEHVQDGIPYIRVSDMSKPVLTTVGMLRTSKQIADRYRRSAVAAGDLVFAIRATVGKMRFVPQELDGANLTQGTARIAPSNRASSAYLRWALQSRNVVDAIAAATKGSTFKEITLGRLRTIPVPLPPIAEQRCIVAELDALQAEVDALKRLQSETAAELDALLPAILDRAFRGEL
jgi:type I restriction enzyme S subunit